MKVRKNDNVLVIAGKDKGKTGKVRYAYPKKEHVLVEGVNFIKRHSRATGRVQQAGIIEREEPIPVSNVQVICSKCNKATRVALQRLDDGTKVRVCRHCKEVID